ncbi:hypothetical protein HID58_004632 [Brassica napus]|uniref:Uncharacterized protein n=1 Tax=Brassica napus TaxID=3708 RepID=A0ABQ8E6A5_BRANA|nr:hypothetical protein HID58_004632 [Brassica napus]
MGGMCMSSCCGGGGGGDDGSSLLLHLLIMVVVCLSVMAVCTSNERRTSVRVARYAAESMLILDPETGRGSRAQRTVLLVESLMQNEF